MSTTEHSLQGGNFGEVRVANKKLDFLTHGSEKPIFDLNLETITQCVVPTNNIDDMEIQFQASEGREKREDCLVQITFHFPQKDVPNEADDQGSDAEGLSLAQTLHQQILGTGILSSSTGDIIVEFSKEEGNFVYPRGKYSMQFTSNYLHMQGAQYAYKLQYDNMDSVFLLPRPDGTRAALVISLHTPIRQGNQKYQNLVLETHKLEHSVHLNLTQEELDTKYEGMTQDLVMPMSSLFGKIFKALCGVKVFVPKQFESARNDHCVRCSIKAADGWLYPLAKSFIFIHKPTLIIKFDDIDSIKFDRYQNQTNSATKNFDLRIKMKASSSNDGKGEEYVFNSIDRTEYSSLFDYMKVKEIKIIDAQDPTAQIMGDLGEDDDDEDDEEDDEDYKGGKDSSSSSDGEGSEDGSGSDNDDDGNASDGSDAKPKKKANKKESTGSKRKAPAPKDDKKKKKKKKDPNAPKRATTAFMAFSNDIRRSIMNENPGMKITDVSKEIGSRWKTISASDKAVFEEKANADKERYAREMKAYKAKGGDAADDDDDDAAEGSGDDDDNDD